MKPQTTVGQSKKGFLLRAKVNFKIVPLKRKREGGNRETFHVVHKGVHKHVVCGRRSGITDTKGERGGELDFGEG